MLDDVDAKLALDQAETKYLAELVKLGITREQAERYVEQFGMTEELIRGEVVERILKEVPAVRQVKAQLDQANRELARQRQLNQRGAGTMQELEQAQNEHDTSTAAYDNAIFTARTVIATAMSNRVALDQARQALQDMTIRAPVPSVFPAGLTPGTPLEYAVTKRDVSEGQMVRESEKTFELVIENPLRLWGTVPERYSTQVKKGQDARLDVTAFRGEAFPGSVVRINPAVDEVSRTFQVELLVPNAEGKLRPGGFAKATIVTASDSNATVVPIESVVRDVGVVKVFVVDGEVARPVEVETGVEGAGWVEIRGSVSPGTQVVITGQAQLADGTPITIRQPPPEETEGQASSPSANEETPSPSTVAADEPGAGKSSAPTDAAASKGERAAPR
jgi:RND family efflux transporter MFP subunit